MASKPNWMMDYEGVPERLAKFFSDYPEGSVQTVVELFDPEANTALIQAHLFRTPDDPRPAIGIAMERASHTPKEIMSEGFVEAAGTHAVGKALENLGYAKKLSTNGRAKEKPGQGVQEPPKREAPRQIKDLDSADKAAMGVNSLSKAQSEFDKLCPGGPGKLVFQKVLAQFQDAKTIGELYISQIKDVDRLIRKRYHELEKAVAQAQTQKAREAKSEAG